MQVVPRLDTGGSEQATVEITEALTRAGALALVATEGGRLATAIRRPAARSDASRGQQESFTILANARRLSASSRSAASRSRPCEEPRAGVERVLAARRTGRPFVTTYHGAYGNPGPIKAAYNSVMGRGDRVIANSLYTAQSHRLAATRGAGAHPGNLSGYRGATFDPLDGWPPGPVARLSGSAGAFCPRHRSCSRRRGSRGWKGQPPDRSRLRAQLNREGALDRRRHHLRGRCAGKTPIARSLIDLIARHGLWRQSTASSAIAATCRSPFLAAYVAVIPSTRRRRPSGGRASRRKPWGAPSSSPISARCPRPSLWRRWIKATSGSRGGSCHRAMVAALADRLRTRPWRLTPAERGGIGETRPAPGQRQSSS